MPVPTPFHPRTQPLCAGYRWKDWAGYLAPCSYGLSPEREYNAIRQASALLDVTPLYKYDVSGPGAAALLSRVVVRDVATLAPGRMAYLCWCEEDGTVLDDGTVARLGEERFRLTSGGPAYYWLMRHAPPHAVQVEEVTGRIAALALQGPTSRALLRQVCDADVDALGFFGVTETRFTAGPGWLSRTGYTGDLGYELWVDNEGALALYDALLHEGRAYGVEPVGLDALDIARIEAGFVLRGVDYVGAHDALSGAQRSTPFELGLGWTVKLKSGAPFVGRPALEREKARGSKWAFVGLDIDFQAIEALYARHGLPPHLPTAAWRTPVPVYAEGRQIGRATSGTWSSILKKDLALATVDVSFSRPGTVVFIEATVEWTRHTVPAVVSALPFFDPPRKRE